MKIEILGTRGEVRPKSPYHSKHSGILVDRLFLFDLGEKEFLQFAPRYIFVTHLHPDHAVFINNPIKIEAALFGPELSSRAPSLSVPSSPIDIEGYRITSVPVHHSKLVKSTAYLIEHLGTRVLYTGDMIWIDKKYHPLLDNLDLVIADGSFMRRGGMIRRDKQTGVIYGHNGIPELVQLFKRFCGRIVFVHFGSWFFRGAKEGRKRLRELGKQNGVLVQAGHDGMNIQVP